MKVLKEFIQKINEQDEQRESVFPMDSPHSGKLPPEPDIGKRRILIDFDGTIHNYTKGFHDGTVYGEPIEGAKEVIECLKRNGYEIVIFTSRISNVFHESRIKDQMQKISEWLDRHGIYYNSITADKVPAEAYIDDVAIPFKNNWKTVLIELMKKLNLECKTKN